MNILVGYDGSNAAKHAIEQALKQAKAFGARTFLVTSQFGGTGEKVEEVNKAKEELEYHRSVFEKEGLECEEHLMIIGRSPWETLLEVAEERKIDMIVIGVRRRSQVDKLVFGSTAQHVILNAPCPVLTVR